MDSMMLRLEPFILMNHAGGNPVEKSHLENVLNSSLTITRLGWSGGN